MTLDMLEDCLNKDLIWRKKEISDLLLLTKDKPEKVFLKSIILLLYAHWEGFIKKSSKMYLQYVSQKNVKLELLTCNFKAIALKTQINKCIESKDTLTLVNELNFIESYVVKENRNFKLSIDINDDFDKKLINTKDNLSPKVFENIMNVIGVKYKDGIKLREEYLDKNLLNIRNTISHGSILDSDLEFTMNIEEIEKLKKIVIGIIDIYRDEIVFYAENELYLSQKKEEKEIYDLKKEKELNKFFESIE